MTKKAELHYGGKVFDIPVVKGTENEGALDISKLREESGLITLDRGFKNTGSTESEITFLNGEQGILRYRGYSIEELAEKSSFLEVSWLLIYGELPTAEELEDFTNDISDHTLVHEDVKSILDGYPSKAHPMGVLSSLTSALTAFNPNDVSLFKFSLNRSPSKSLTNIFCNFKRCSSASTGLKKQVHDLFTAKRWNHFNATRSDLFHGFSGI